MTRHGAGTSFNAEEHQTPQKQKSSDRPMVSEIGEQYIIKQANIQVVARSLDRPRWWALSSRH